MADPSAALQTALISRYRADTPLQGLLVGATSPTWNIFDQGGSGAIVSAFPGIFIHPITSQLGSAFAFGTDSMDVFVQISVFTQMLGFSQARAIAARIYALTHGPIASPLTIAGFTNVSMLFDNRQELEETTDVQIQHIADRYKIITQG